MSYRHLISLVGILAFGLSVPARASANPIEARDVQHVFSPNQHTSHLLVSRISNIYYLPVTDLEIPTRREDQPRTPKVNIESESLLSGVGFYAFAQDPQKQPLGTVDVAICDCGDVTVPIAGGGFPKWPLVFLAGIPFLFIKGSDDVLPPIPAPTPPGTVEPRSGPTPPPPSPTPTITVDPRTNPPGEIPEPASLLLFFTGVCAVGLRLRKSLIRNRE